MFCPKCGTQVPQGSRFCPECGAPLPVAEAPVAPPVEEVPVTAPPPEAIPTAAPVTEPPAAPSPEEVPVTTPPEAEIPTAAPGAQAPVTPPPPEEIPRYQTPPPVQTPPPTQTPPPPGQTPPPPYPPYSDQTPEAKKASKVPIILLVIGVVALLAVVVFLVLKFLLPGGGSPQEAVTKAMAKMSASDNYQAAVEMEMALNVLGQDAELWMDGDISVLPERSVTGFDMDVSAAGVSQSMSMYMVEEDGYVTTYTNEYGEWRTYTDVAEDSDRPTAAEAEDAAKELLSIATNLSYDGTEQVQGATANRYSFDIALGDILDYADQTQLDALDEVFSEMDIDGEALFSETEPLTMAVLVDPASGDLVGMEMDFAEMLRDLFNNLMTEAMESSGVSGVSVDITVDAAKLRMEFFNYGSAQEVVIPPEALASY